MRAFTTEYYQMYKIYKYEEKKYGTLILAMNVKSLDRVEALKHRSIPVKRYVKMNKYQREIDKKLLMGNEILFEYGLKQLDCWNIDKMVERGIDKAGKPFISNQEGLYFNMSHSKDFSVCAFSYRPLGIDVEFRDKIDLSIAERHYRKEEYTDIISRPKEFMYKRFYEYWVLKESFTKAVGLGLTIPLHKFSFSDINNRNEYKVIQSINKNKYYSEAIPFIDSNYELAFCVES